jgi:hypothetical protein
MVLVHYPGAGQSLWSPEVIRLTLTPMGKISGNAAGKLSGRIDDFVYRQTLHGVVVARRPRPRVSTRKPKKSAAQATQQERFRCANLYAHHVLEDPLARRAYERLAKERQRRFDRLVVADYLTPPEIEHIELGGYHGRAREMIRVLAWDDVEVVSVQVQIHTTGGMLVEAGEARPVHGVWTYTATVDAPANDHLVITIAARDRPDNAVTQKVVYP